MHSFGIDSCISNVNVRQEIESFTHTPAINLNVHYGKRDAVRGKAAKDHFTFFGSREQNIKKLENVKSLLKVGLLCNSLYCSNFVLLISNKRCKKVHNRRDPFNQNSNRSDREKRTTSKGGPVFSKLFRLDRTDPLSFGPKFPEILLEWIAPNIQSSFTPHWLKLIT